ncbi:MAG: TMEM175 family protein [Fimbriimonas sp.]
MLREASLRGGAEAKDPIRWRGREISRMEALTDGMFAIAITLLVVAVEVPPSFDAMRAQMGGFFAFALCFAMMVWVWTAHNVFFRRFGMDDAWTMTLNFALTFVVLFFVYPLKFVANSFVAFLRYRMDGTTSAFNIRPGQLPELFTYYGLGFIAVFGIYGLLYLHAYRRRESLELTERERTAVRIESTRYFSVACVGVLSVALATLTKNVLFAGTIYWLIGMVEWWHGHRMGRLARSSP